MNRYPQRLSRKILYGGDYNPDQWPQDTWESDYEAFNTSCIDTVTLGVFSWSLVQRGEDDYHFAMLDQIVDRAVRHKRNIILATATGAMPPWLVHQFPETARTDFEGRRKTYGGRHNHCPSSVVFRRFSYEIARRVAVQYSGLEEVIAWHVSNEYGGACYCENCAVGFRVWLEKKYGTTERMNAAWNGAFWSHLFTDFDEVVPPNALSEHWDGPSVTAFQGITLDYKRFMSDSLLENYLNEKSAIRSVDPVRPVTTNFMGMFEGLDYHAWAPHIDVISWDNYPRGDRVPARMAMAHDLMRGLKDGAPFWLMEQTPSVTANRRANALKPPGVMRLWSWQAVAHGADAVLFFQLKQSPGASEKYHGAVLDHAGRTDNRTFKEVAALGAELELLGNATLGGRTPSRVALIFDWDNWWTVETTDGINRDLDYRSLLLDYYTAVWEHNVPIDVVPIHADLSNYDVVLAPYLHMLKGDIAERLRMVAERGGTIVTSCWSGRVDETGNAFASDAPGALRKLFGVRVEETDSRPPEISNHITLSSNADPGALSTDGTLVMEILVPEGAEVVGAYSEDFYAGRAAVTRHEIFQGEAWYLGTRLDPAGMKWIMQRILDRQGISQKYSDFESVETTVRELDGQKIRFIINHGNQHVELNAQVTSTNVLTMKQHKRGSQIPLPPTGVLILREVST